jgi:O-antigen biosynthesis protein
MSPRGADAAPADGVPDAIRLFELELGGSLSSAGPRCTARRYRRGRVLVRLHGAPVGAIDVDLDDGEPVLESIAVQARRELRTAIDAHLAADGIAAGEELLPSSSPARCEHDRARFAARAPFASVVIATRERPGSLASTLDDLRALRYPRFEVIVVDNAPTTDATLEVVGRYADLLDLHYVREPVPGLAIAHNRGLAAARGEIVAFTDDDVAVDPLWLLELCRGFERSEGVGCVTGLIFPAELETPAQVWLESWVGVNKGYEPKLFDLDGNHPGGWLFPYAAGAFGSGANMAFRTDTIRALGGFDPATGTGTRARGGDDLAAFFTVVAAGHTLMYQPSAIVRHAYRRDLQSLHRQMYNYGAGLGAYLTKVVVDRPGRALDIAWRAPFAVAHALRSRPSRRRGGEDAAVSGLARRERLGMLAGPAGYVIERHRRRSLYAHGVRER